MTTPSKGSLIARRGDLLAEFFLQELSPSFVARSSISDFMFDFFVGFKNPRGGINAVAIEVKATERAPNGFFLIRENIFRVMANSNIPTLLIVADVKNNELFYSWPIDEPSPPFLRDTLRIRVRKIDEEAKRQLAARMSA